MNGETVFYDLCAIAENGELISDRQAEGKWEAIPYETAYFKGKMLCAGECVEPAPITLNVGLSGWHRIYLGLTGVSYNTKTGITIGRNGKNVFDLPPVYSWDAQAFIAEECWGAADMSGEKITLFKPEGYANVSSGLAYIRFEKMSEKEIEEYTATDGGVISYHLDEDYYGENAYSSPQEYLGKINMFGGSGGGVLFTETTGEGLVLKEEEYGLPYSELIRRRVKYSQFFHKNRLAVKTAILSRAKELGFQVYAAKRIQAGDFTIPLSRQMLDSGAVNAETEKYRIRTRDGRYVNALSFAYKSVRETAIDSLIESMDGCDYAGVSLTFHRGVFIGFEEPVSLLAVKRYGVNAEKLPVGDKRLSEIWGEFITEFMRELRARLDALFGKGVKKINAITFTDAVSSKNFGLDVELWAKEGLVDSVSQGIMAWKEDLSDCIDKDGLVDTEKYRTAASNREVIARNYDGTDLTAIINGAKSYVKLLKPYKTEFLGTLGWESATVKDTYALAEELKKVGVKRLFSWNGNHKARRPWLLNAEKDISLNFNKEIKPKSTLKYYRVLSVGGKDISEFNANWNG